MTKEAENIHSYVNQKRFASLDGLKGIGACIIAFAWHYQHFKPQEGTPFHEMIPISFDYGQDMVELFFMISGLAMMIGYSERVLNKSIGFRSFILKRVRALFPAFLFFTILTAILEIVHISQTGTTFKYGNFDLYHFFLNLLILQDGYFGREGSFDSPSWCISICMICYMLFYLILSHVKEQHHLYYWFTATFFVGAFLYKMNLNAPLVNAMVGRGFMCFSYGVVLYGILDNKDKLRTTRLGYTCLIIMIASYCIYRFLPNYIGEHRLAFVLLIAPSIILSSMFIPWFGKLLGIKPLAYLGKISLYIYLIHYPVQCTFAVADKIFGLGINYSSRLIWIFYAFSVLVLASFYEIILSKKVEETVCGFFVRKEDKAKE